MIRADELFMNERENEMMSDEDANFLQMKEQEEHQQYEEDQALPVIDMNTLKPVEQTQLMDLGGEYPELVDMTSVQLSEHFINAIVEGKIDPLRFVIKKKLLEQALAVAVKNPDVKVMIEEEVRKYPKGQAKLYGATVSMGSRRKYNYAEDSKWKQINDQVKPMLEEQKDQEKKIQAAVNNGANLVSNDGELLASCVNAPGSTFPQVSFKKK